MDAHAPGVTYQWCMVAHAPLVLLLAITSFLVVQGAGSLTLASSARLGIMCCHTQGKKTTAVASEVTVLKEMMAFTNLPRRFVSLGIMASDAWKDQRPLL
jgi:hypothetical protein